ncbi:hypothetical protein BDR06DRAFT_969492 [Suillus hirtellus]|nr:hypothetical protein BDR06DRAFT_969492 [Suillus hirtellus]
MEVTAEDHLPDRKQRLLHICLIGHKNTINCLSQAKAPYWQVEITHQEVTHETLCYGTGLGFIGIWQQHGKGLEDFDAKISRRISTGKEIMCLTYDHSGNDTCIATRTHNTHVQVWLFDFKGP